MASHLIFSFLPYLILPCLAFSLRWTIIPLFHIDDMELHIGRSSFRREKDGYWKRQGEALGLFIQKLCFEYTMTDCGLRNPAVVVASGEQWSVCDCLQDVWRLGILDSSDGEEIFLRTMRIRTVWTVLHPGGIYRYMLPLNPFGGRCVVMG